MAEEGFICADAQSCSDRTSGLCYQNIGTLPEYYARWYGAHLWPEDGRVRVWLRYEDLLLKTDRTAETVCSAAGMVLPSGGLKMPEHKAGLANGASRGADINASEAITKAVDSTSLYDGIEPALVARVANQINAVSPGLLDALGYSLAVESVEGV